jgi:cytochrome P450 family 103
MRVSTPAPGTGTAGEPPTVTNAELDSDPHRLLRHYRLISPVLRRDDNSYIVIRSGDVKRLTGDPRLRQLETERLHARGIRSGELYDVIENSMLYSNGAVHRRRRAPMTRAFGHRLITALRPKIRAVAHNLIDRVEARGGMDLLDDYAALIPAQMMTAILGLPEEDVPRFTRWVYSMSRAIGSPFSSSEFPELESAAANLNAYARDFLAKRLGAASEDFVDSFATGLEAEAGLTAKEILAQIVTTIVAGSDTTRAAIAVQTSLLVQHREQWEAVRHDSTLIASAVSESLRFEPAVATIPRFTTEAIELGDYVVPAGRILSLSTMSAMRDPALFAEPDQFHILRTDASRRHLVFGAGAHRCLGETLARAELEEGLAVVLERLPKLRLLNGPTRLWGHNGIRRVFQTPVVWP